MSINNFRLTAEKRDETGVHRHEQVLNMAGAEECRALMEADGWTVNVRAPSCPFASGFKCYEGCAAACVQYVAEDLSSVRYSCGATFHALGA